jgi:hypothetical protein
MSVEVAVTIDRSKNTKELHMAKMREVAAYIVSNPPSWLTEVLSDFSFDVASANSIDTIWPTRKELMDSLSAVGSQALQLSEVLKEAPMVGFLISNSEMKSEDFVPDLIFALSKLATYARQARGSRELVGADGNILPGRGKARLPGETPPKYVCAAIVDEVWAFFHDDKNPARSNKRAWGAADHLWKSWVRKTDSWGNDPLKGWKRYFDGISAQDLQPLRNEVRRHLNNRLHLGNLMSEENNAGQNGTI